MVSRPQLLGMLPAFRGLDNMIAEDQTVWDIVFEVLKAHKAFAGDYDQIAECFNGGTIRDTCRRLFDFCLRELPYEAESDLLQTTRSPSGILAMAEIGGKCDCKHYAGFCGGVIDAISRMTGQPIDWCYRFASYNLLDESPQHVFIVVNNNGNELWVDPAPIEKQKGNFITRSFDDRLSKPWYKTDKKISMSLVRMSGVSGGFTSSNVVRRSDLELQNGGPAMGYLLPDSENFYDQLYPDGSASGFVPESPYIPVYLPIIPPEGTAAISPGPAGVTYTIDGNSLIFPPKGSKAIIPENLIVTYPATFEGRQVPADLPRPLVVGNRLVLLPKIATWDYVRENDYYWFKVMVRTMAPLIASYSQFPDWNIGISESYEHKGTLSNVMLYDLDYDGIIDYITSKPVTLPMTADVPPGVKYMAGGVDLVWPANRSLNSGDYNQNNMPPQIPADLKVIYPAMYGSIPVPANLPVPVVKDGRLYLSPKTFTVDQLRENGFLWFTWLRQTMAPLINAYAKYPYAGSNDDLADRIWADIAGSNTISNYLDEPVTKTFLGQVIDKVGDVVELVGKLIVKFIGIIPRTAFIGLIRLNVHGWATAMYERITADQEGEDDVKHHWQNLGGSWGDLHDAIDDGRHNPRLLGIGIGEPVSVGAALAAAAPVIAAMAALLKAISPQSAAAVDGAVDAINVILKEAGEDPIKLAGLLNKPVVITDPVTGNKITIPPPAPKSTSGGIFDFIKANPVEAAVGAALIGWGVYEVTKKKGRR